MDDNGLPGCGCLLALPILACVGIARAIAAALLTTGPNLQQHGWENTRDEEKHG